VLITGGAGLTGAAVVRRLLRDPSYEVRVWDQRPAPQWMREGCEVRTGDLRDLDEARSAISGCSYVVHAGSVYGGIAQLEQAPHTVGEFNAALDRAVIHAALDHVVERFVYVSSARVFERATQFPTTEEHLADCPPPRSAFGFSKLMGEVFCRAAQAEHGLPATICRPFNPYGPGEVPGGEPGHAQVVTDLVARALDGRRPLEIFGSGKQTRTLTHVDDLAEGIVAALTLPDALGGDFNLGGTEELTVAEIARLVWEACGHDPGQLELRTLDPFSTDVERRWPSSERARRVLGWKPRIDARSGIAGTVAWLREELAREAPVAAA
jgi:nucleoside-diphosphate-sugar epimerase